MTVKHTKTTDAIVEYAKERDIDVVVGKLVVSLSVAQFLMR